VRLTIVYGVLFLLAGAALILIFAVFFRDNYPSPKSVAAVLSASGHLSPTAVIIVRRELDLHRARDLTTMTIQSIIAIAIVATVSMAVGWAVAGQALRPIRRITETARRVAGRHLHERISLRGPDDELKELADTFDAMLDRLDAAFEAQRQFVANASHELRTPIATNRAVLEVALAAGRVPAEVRDVVDTVLQASCRSELIIDGLLTLARSEGQTARRVPVDLSDIAASAIEQTAGEAARARVEVDASPQPAPAVGDPVLLERVAMNLVRNGIRHNHPGGWLRVSTAAGPGAGEAELTVANSGPVIPPDQLDGLFEPFRRLEATRASGVEGAGLGLSIVRSVVRGHDGRLVATARPDGGLLVQVLLTTRPATPPDTSINGRSTQCSSPTCAANCAGACARPSLSHSAWRWESAS
jgi:signal transduction histidine kinase